MLRELLSDLAIPLTRRLPFRRLSVVALLSGKASADVAWLHARRRYRTLDDRIFRAKFRIDLADISGRSHYYAGIFYDQSQRLLAERFLAGGDCTYIDVGANNGLQSIAVASATNRRCRIVSIEPSPKSFAILQANLALNGLKDVRTHNVGLSDATGELELRGVGGHTGTDTMRPLGGATRVDRVPVVRGDDLLADLRLVGKLLVKIDTEGYEHLALKGMAVLLSYDATAVCVEVTPEWLEQTGSSASALFADLLAGGFDAWQMFEIERFGSTTLRLVPLEGPSADAQYNVLFAKPAFSEKLSRHDTAEIKS